MKADTWIKTVAVLAVVAVAVFAAVVSYSHIFVLGTTHGQDGTAARLLPLTIDMQILAAGLFLITDPDRKLARFMLWMGIIETIGANFLYGWHYGWLLGAVLSALPAVALVGSVELLVGCIRTSPAPESTGSAQERAPAPEVQDAAPAPRAALDLTAVRERYAAECIAGELPSARRIAQEMHVGQAKAGEYRRALELEIAR